MEIKNYEGMFLDSESGYMMPFAVMEDEQVEVILPYGKQPHPKNGGVFDHKGIDYLVKDKPLYAIASGMVIGIGNDAIHEDYIVVRYGSYDVTYGHIKDVRVKYGDKVGAGQIIAKSKDFLHFGVSYEGNILDPDMFLSMVWANIQQLAALGIETTPAIQDLSDNTPSRYDNDHGDIMMLILRWLPSYINEVMQGSYTPSGKLISNMKRTLQMASERQYFYETMPNIGNPLGLTKRAAPLASKLNDLLIGDFLTFLVSKYGIYPPSWTEDEKKNFQRRYMPVAQQ